MVGLVGQTNGEAVVVENEEDLDQIDFSRPVVLFSQTTARSRGGTAYADAFRSRIHFRQYILHPLNPIRALIDFPAEGMHRE